MTGTNDETALLALLREQRMLLFVGAGLSLELGYPLWDNYLAALEKELGAEAPSTGDPLDRAEWIKRSFAAAQRLPDYLAHIQQTFGPKSASSYTPLQRALVRLGFRGVITTNFDLSLENALSAENLAVGRPACTALDLGDPRAFSVFDFFRLTSRRLHSGGCRKSSNAFTVRFAIKRNKPGRTTPTAERQSASSPTSSIKLSRASTSNPASVTRRVGGMQPVRRSACSSARPRRFCDSSAR